MFRDSFMVVWGIYKEICLNVTTTMKKSTTSKENVTT